MKPLEAATGKKPMVVVGAPCGGRNKTVVVLGAEHDGTSMVAGMLRVLGVDMGEGEGGKYEHLSFLTDDRDKLLSQIKTNNERKGLWGFKATNAFQMMGFYDEHLSNPHYILVFKNFGSTVEGCSNYVENDSMQSVLYAMEYYDLVLGFLKGKGRPLVFAGYERVCDFPEVFFRQLADFLDLDVAESAILSAAPVVGTMPLNRSPVEASLFTSAVNKVNRLFRRQ